MTVPPSRPVIYDPSMEVLEADEAQVDSDIVQTMSKINETTFNNGGVGLRSVHAKSHGVLVGELTVPALPAIMAQGLFAKPATYPVLMRFSTTPGDIMDDSVSTPRGLAIKVVGVEGARVEGSETAVTQDLVMVNGPVFQRQNPAGFLKDLKLLQPTTDKLEGVKKAASALFRGTEALIEAFGGKSSKVIALGGQAATNILGETFYTQVPMLYGPYIGKVSVAPVSPELQALTDAKLDLDGKPNAIRDAVIDFFKTHGGSWEVRVQLCTDVSEMPIEQANVPWSEEASPYVTVATITVPPQDAWSAKKIDAIDAGLSFSPWNALAAHRPLGSIMRARKRAYEMSAQFRAAHNHQPIHEPRSAADLPG